MDHTELEELIRNGESSVVDLKRDGVALENSRYPDQLFTGTPDAAIGKDGRGAR